MRKPVVIAAAAACTALLMALAAPAGAACDPTAGACSEAPVTEVAFEVGLGTLTITSESLTADRPVPAELGSSGARATIPLGRTTVKDTRISPAGWTVTATVTDFVTTGGSIGRTNAAFSVAPGWTAPAGMALPEFSTAPSTAPKPVDATGSRALLSVSAGATNTGVVFTPVLTVTVPPGKAAGVYTGTVTQSVS